MRIGNFKAFGETQRVPIKPLTLIFGANSSGKSSIIHSLLLARHIWQGGCPDARTLHGQAKSVDLGGFDQFVHGQDTKHKVVLGLKFAVLENPTLCKAAPSGDLSAAIRLHKRTGTATLSTAVEILEGDQMLARLWPKEPENLDPEDCYELAARFCGELARILRPQSAFWQGIRTRTGSWEFLKPEQSEEYREKFEIDRKMILKWMFEGLFEQGPGPLLPRISDTEDALRTALGDEQYQEQYYESRIETWHELRRFISALGFQFSDPLVYLGPVRFYPPRLQLEAPVNDPNYQDGGGSSWDEMLEDEASRQSVSRLLERISGYRLDLREWKDTSTPARQFKELVITESRGLVLSARDVGVGVSQVLPVLHLSAAKKGSMLAIEQPEIHLHPALQAELGDVFIESALGERKNTFLLETHSEHLILRILRRIREGTAGTPTGLPAIRPEDVAVLYVTPSERGSRVKELPVTPDGDFSEPWPDGFFPERAKELF